MRRLAVAACAAGLAVGGIVASPARADAPVDQGWWTSTTPGGLPIGAVTPPDVPAEGLLIQGGPGTTSGAGDTGATAYAGLVFGLAPNATVGNLTLTSASNTVTTPNAVLELCVLTDSAFSSVQGGPISAAPPYDCSRNATAKASGSTFTFPVARLVSGNQLAVAILPTSPVERVVLAPPGASALAVTDATPSSLPAQGSTTPTTAAPGSTATSAPAPAAGPLPAATRPAVISGSPAPAVVAGPAVAPLADTSATTAAVGSPSQPAAAVVPGIAKGSPGGNPAVAIVAVTLAVLAGALWFMAGRPATGRSPAENEAPVT